MRKEMWLLGIYTVILLVAAALFYTVVEERNPYVTEAEFERVTLAGDAFRDAVQHGHMDELTEVVQKQQWEFDFERSQLRIDSQLRGLADVFVEQSEQLEHTIQVMQYMPQHIAASIDITDEIPPVVTELRGNMLTITEAEQIRYIMAQFSREFVINQFVPIALGGPFTGRQLSMHTMDQKAIVVRVPVGVAWTME